MLVLSASGRRRGPKAGPRLHTGGCTVGVRGEGGGARLSLVRVADEKAAQSCAPGAMRCAFGENSKGGACARALCVVPRQSAQLG